MNYFEIINKCLLELNYKQVNSFSELIKNDHKRIKEIINVLNREICSANKWKFLLRTTTLTLSANQYKLKNTIDGRILYLYIDGKKYDYSENIEKFLSGHANACMYSSMGEYLLFPKFSTDKTIEVVYYTRNCVRDENENEKSTMEYATDESLIPIPFSQELLIYGTCLRLKANPQHYKFPYWMSQYRDALANLKSMTSVSAEYAPEIKVFRK